MEMEKILQKLSDCAVHKDMKRDIFKNCNGLRTKGASRHRLESLVSVRQNKPFLLCVHYQKYL